MKVHQRDGAMGQENCEAVVREFKTPLSLHLTDDDLSVRKI
jgi:hypothetical protein